MNFLNSIIFGKDGQYTIFGINVAFQKPDTDIPYHKPSDSDLLPSFLNSIQHIPLDFLNSRTFQVLTQGYCHVFFHEMGHCIASKFFANNQNKIDIFTNILGGYSKGLAQNSIVYLAGPMAGMTFSACKLLTVLALKTYLSTPIVLLLGTGSLLWMTGELLYAATSACGVNFGPIDLTGDFGKIAENSSLHLALATAALVGEYALAIFVAYNFCL